MKILHITIIMALIIISLCIGRIVWWVPPTYYPDQQTTPVALNMRFIGKMLASGKIYCDDNITVRLVYENSTRSVSLKDICDTIDRYSPQRMFQSKWR